VGGVIATLLWLIWGGVTTNAKMAFDFPPNAFSFSSAWFAGLGAAMVRFTAIGLLEHLPFGREIRDPERNIPRGIFLSVFGIAALYLAMQTSILGVIPWREAQHSNLLSARLWSGCTGTAQHRYMVMVLWIALASVFSVLLGYSVPYSAALDGNFSGFWQAAPTKHFPHISLLALGALAFFFSVKLDLETSIAGILAVRLIVQFIGQAVGVMLLRKRLGTERLPFRMWLYPMPAVLTMLGWAWLFWQTGAARKWGLLEIVLGVLAFLVWTAAMKQWPFEKNQTSLTSKPLQASQ
jgi:amino acid transporter